MNNEIKIVVIDEVLRIIESDVFETEISKNFSLNFSGICPIIGVAMRNLDISYAEKRSFKMFFNHRRPTRTNEWKEFLDPKRTVTAWWWRPYDFTQRIIFLKALKQSLIK